MDVFSNFFSNFGWWGAGWTGWVVPTLFGFTIIVFFHELGHFVVARLCGVRVLVFSVGFGRELLGFTDRHGTRWKIAAIPLGGYVKFLGDENVASVPDQAAVAGMSADERRASFHAKPVSQRAAIVAAGPIANFLLAIVIFAGVFTFFGKQTTSARVDAVQPDSPAAAAGIRAGDIVVAIDGRSVESFSDMQRIVSASAARTLEFKIDRGGTPVVIKATPALKRGKDGLGNDYCHAILGVSRSMTPTEVKTVSVDPLTALWLGTKETWSIIDRTFSYIGGVFAGRECVDQLGGPIRIAQISGQVATLGFMPVLQLAAVLSVSIGLLNLFPVPLLDGGHLLFYSIEAARGRPLSERAQEIGFRIGFALVVMLMIFTVFNDILQLLSRFGAS
jgi:regulator of sigma E protease